MPIRIGGSLDEIMDSKRRDFGDLAAAKRVTFKTGSTIVGRPGTAAPARPWYKEPRNYVVAGIVLALIFGPSLMTHGGRARTPRPFG